MRGAIRGPAAVVIVIPYEAASWAFYIAHTAEDAARLRENLGRRVLTAEVDDALARVLSALDDEGSS
jgi:hypothetical protein